MPFNCKTLSSDKFLSNQCLVCCEDKAERLVDVSAKGRLKLSAFSSSHGCEGLQKYLESNPSKVFVHENCRKRFTDSRLLSSAQSHEHEVDCVSNRKLRSTAIPFKWKDMCLFCEETIVGDDDSRVAMTIDLKTKIMKQCNERKNDDWSIEVKGRLESVIDLPAADAVYHATCLIQFYRSDSEQVCEALNVSGRHVDSSKLSAFNEFCEQLEMSCDKLFSLDELHEQMSSLVTGDVYSKTHLKRKLMERYGDHIIFSEVCGRKNVICFRDMCSFILSDKWYSERDTNVEVESDRLIRSAGKLIAAQIRNMTYDISKYPTASEIHADDSSLVPPLLRTLMSILVPVKLKRSAISQCIIQAARPRTTIQPIPFGLGIQMDHAFGSRFLIQELARLGLCVSYDEVVRYKQSVVMSQTPQHASAPCYPYAYTQWVADNVDHNVRTLDGFGTLHAMGLISASTAVSGEVGVSSTPVNRLSNRLLSAEVVRNRGIKIVQYHGEECSWLTTISMQPIEQLYKPIECSQLTALNLIWHAGWFTSDVVRPNWSGFMQNVCHGDHSSAATIQFLPILDLNPSDNTCIYSTLLHVIDQAKQLGILTPCITFDMPLWLKAVEISNTKKLPIVCKLGGFHMIMSFLGSIGHLLSRKSR